MKTNLHKLAQTLIEKYQPDVFAFINMPIHHKLGGINLKLNTETAIFKSLIQNYQL
jgi:hypothetical protein